MKKVQTLEQIQKLNETELRTYLTEKTQAMFAEYGVDNLDDIGCYVLLEAEEMFDFDVKAMEFVEVLEFENETYLHGAKILSDSYGEDFFCQLRWYNVNRNSKSCTVRKIFF